MNHKRPFRFGITSTGISSREAWLALARKSEAQGYSTLLISDHLHNQIAPVASLLAAADATTTLRVGSYLFGNDFRHPVYLAQEAATVDLMSGGRLELGLGTGWLLADYEKSGMAFDSPGVRVARLQEAVEVIKGCWSDSAFAFAGAHYRVRDLNGLPKPTQKPHPPLLIGGGSQRILSFAAREADIVGINFKTTREGWVDFSSMLPEAFDQKVAWIRESAGDRFERLELNVYVPNAAITLEPRQAAQNNFARLRAIVDDVAIDAYLESPMVLAGTVDQAVEMLRYRRERFGFSYIVLRQEVADEFAPVVERLAGT